jgi:hypothetical protein
LSGEPQAVDPHEAQSSPAAAAEMTARLQGVLAAGERAAEAIREDARRQVDRYMDEVQEHADWLTAERVRLVSELTDELVAHAAAIRSHSQNLIAALEQAASLVEAQVEGLAAAEMARDQPSSTSRDASK